MAGLAVGLHVPAGAQGHDEHAEHGEQHSAHATGIRQERTLLVLDLDDRDSHTGGRSGTVDRPGFQRTGGLVDGGLDGDLDWIGELVVALRGEGLLQVVGAGFETGELDDAVGRGFHFSDLVRIAGRGRTIHVVALLDERDDGGLVGVEQLELRAGEGVFGGAFLVNLLQVEVEGVTVGFGRGRFADAILAGVVAVLDLGGVEVAGVVLVRGADERVLVQSRGVGDENLLAGLGRIVGLHVVGQVDGDGRLPTRGHAVISSDQRSITDLDGDVVVEVKPRGKGIDDLEDVIRVFGGVRNLGLELEVHLAADLGAVALLVGIDGLVDGRVFGLQIDVLGRGGDVDKHRIRVARVGSGTGLRAHHVVAKREVLKSSDVGVTGGLRHRCRTHRRDIVASILGPVGSLGGELGQFRVLVRLLQTVYVVVGLFGDVGIGHIRDNAGAPRRRPRAKFSRGT